MFDRILAPISFGQATVAVPSRAIALAEQSGAELHVLFVLKDALLSRAESREMRQAQAQKELDQLPVGTNRVDVHREVRRGSFSETVLAYTKAKQVDLVVLDRQGSETSLERDFRATVNRLLDALPCPILITRGGHEVTASDVDRAMRILRGLFGNSLPGDHEPTKNEMLTAIQREMDMSDQDAESLFAELEASGAVTWEQESDNASHVDTIVGGKWTIQSEDEARVEFVSTSNDSEMGMASAIDLLKRGIAARATDIHIDPREKDSYVVRFRIDGRMHDYCTMQVDVAGSVMKQLKVMAEVSLSDPFQPTESRLKLPQSIPNYEVRITTAPVVNGQAIALRLIHCDKLYRPLNELGLSANSFSAVYQMLHQRSGLVLIAGPTGAGKTTTAYSMLNVLFTGQHNIVSIEDPVELLVPFIRQLSVDKRHGVTMDVALSTILRMDPDVVFVGEIRNADAAHVAMQAAGCGKRAFSTMHMRDVSATVTAMRKLDVDAKTLADNLTGVITQRLVRRVCQDCSQLGPITKHEHELFSSREVDPPSEVVRARGCDRCRGTGFRERIGVFEAVVIEGAVQEAIRQEKSEDELRRVIRDVGTPGLLEDGLGKVLDGVTAIDEVQEMSWLSDSILAPHLEGTVEEDYERGAPYKGALTHHA